MSVNIDSVTIGGVEDRRVVLNNADLAGWTTPLATANWTKIRIGVRWALADTGANITGTPRIYLGVMQSPSANLANGPVGATTSFMVGLINNAATFTRNAGPPVFYTGINSGGTSYAWKQNNSIGTVAGTSTTYAISAANTTNRSVFIVELTRNAGTIDIRFCGPIVTAPPDCPDVNILKNAVQLDGTNSANLVSSANYLSSALGGNWNGASVGSPGFTLAQTAPLNAVVVGWTPSVNLYVSDLYYSIILP